MGWLVAGIIRGLVGGALLLWAPIGRWLERRKAREEGRLQGRAEGLQEASAEAVREAYQRIDERQAEIDRERLLDALNRERKA